MLHIYFNEGAFCPVRPLVKPKRNAEAAAKRRVQKSFPPSFFKEDKKLSFSSIDIKSVPRLRMNSMSCPR